MLCDFKHFDAYEYEKKLSIKYSCYLNNLKSTLRLKRYYHCIGVAYTASVLAELYGVDNDKAILAGLLHDAVKNREIEVRQYLSSKELDDIPQGPVEHAFLAPYSLKYEYKIVDEEILNAVKYHTTGHPNMTKLEKIIFISDAIEPNRKYRSVNYVRDLAFSDLDRALVHILRVNINNLRIKNAKIHPLTLQAYKYYDGGL